MSDQASSSSKRPASPADHEYKKESPVCKYGEKCYRKNPQHFKEFSHPHLDHVEGPIAKRQKIDALDTNNVCHQCTCFLVTKVTGISSKYNTNNLSINIKEILSTAYGELEASAQFNYMFEIPWLMEQYPLESRNKPLLIVHGDTGERKSVLETEASAFENVQLFQAQLSISYGTHHSKMMFLLYKDGLRVVIHTANLVESDWNQKTQGVWMSPKFRRLDESSANDDLAEDRFKRDLLEYLDAYGTSDKLEIWKKEIKSHDMTEAKARIIASVPGRHTGMAKLKWGHLRLRSLLQQIGPDLSSVDGNWPVIGQFSSIGSLGSSERTWLCTEWLQSLSSGRRKFTGAKDTLPSLKLVFPTVENVRTSLEGYRAGGSLPYNDYNAKKQMYLLGLFHQWKSDNLGRTRASPHIKSYARISPDNSRAAWFLLTSANLSKAAWGVCEKNSSQLMIRSYEVGVLLLPRNYDAEAHSFKIAMGCSSTNDEATQPLPWLYLPYDLPLTPYNATDSPWIWDRNYVKEDSLSGIWMPRQ